MMFLRAPLPLLASDVGQNVTIPVPDFVTVEEVNTEKTISPRTAASAAAVGSGQGFVRCLCLEKCISNHCQCKKKNMLCSSKWHNSALHNNK